VLWSKDGGELPDVERMIVEGPELTITTLNRTDNGTYGCRASNHLGSSSAEFILFVYGTPSPRDTDSELLRLVNPWKYFATLIRKMVVYPL
jgi:cell adhesion protein 4